MPNFNTLRYVNGYYKPAAASTATVELESVSNSTDGYIVKYDSEGAPQWAARIGSGSTDQGAYSVATDSSNNVYVVGSILAKGGIYNANGTLYDVFPNAGGGDAFIVKYNSAGAVQWVGRVASSIIDVAWKVVVDSSGNVIVTGAGGAGVTVTAFNANGTAFSPSIANAGNTDVFIVEYNSSGSVQWLARIASSADDIGYSVATDSTNSIYVTGQGGSGAAVTAFNANGTTFGNVANSGSNDAFLIKYNSSGTVQWMTRLAGTGADIAFAIDSDTSDNVYVTGVSGGATLTAFSVGGVAFGTTVPAGDAFVVKYNSSGAVQWVARVTSTGTDTGYGIATDTSGAVYVTGQGGVNVTVSAVSSNGVTFGTTLASLGQTDIFLVKFDTAGIVQWVTRLGTTNNEIGYDVATDSSNNVYITGYIGATAVNTSLAVYNSNGTLFGSLANNTIGTFDAFLIKYNSGGTVQWARSLASINSDTGRAVTVDSSGNPITCGSFTATRYSLYGQSLTLFSSTAISGTSDGFVIKYNTNGSPQWTAQITSTGLDVSYGTAVDSSGNLYVTGHGGAATITAYNSDGSAFGTTIPNAGGTDAFIIKYNSSGFVQWVARVASTGGDIGYSISVDASGNVIVTGSCGEVGLTTTAYNSDGTAFATTLPSAGSSDVFIVKYNSSGTVQWVARAGTGGIDRAFAIATDSSSNIYITGISGSGTMTAYNSNGTAFGTTYPSTGDAFVVKYNSSGTVQWLTRISSASNDSGQGIATDSSGNVYISGVGGTAAITVRNGDGTVFNATTPTFPAFAGGTSFLVKYDTNGTVQWATRLLTASMAKVAVDSSANVFVVGTFATTATMYSSDGTIFDSLTSVAAGNDAFLVKYNTSGIGEWTAQIGSSAAELATSVAVDSAGSAYFVGFFGPSSSLTLPRFTVYNAFGAIFGSGIGSYGIAKYDSTGIPQWVQSIDRITSVNDACVSSTGDIYTTGQSLSGTMRVMYLDFTPYKFLNSFGGQDAFVVKYSSAATPQWAAKFASSATDVGNGIATDSSGNVIVIGQGGSGVTTSIYNANGTVFASTLSSAGGSDAILCKYDTSGSVQWAARIASTGTDIGFGVATDGSGNIYVTGQGGSGVAVTAFSSNGTAFSPTIANAGGTDVFIVKYSSSGVVQWVARIASTAGDIGYSVAVDSSGNIAVAGAAGAATTVAYNSDQTAFATTLPSAGNGDAFVALYNTNGFVQWIARIASTGVDTALGVAIDQSSGRVYVTGQTGSAVTTTIYNADGSAFGTTLPTIGLQDAYIAAYSSTGVVQWVARMGSTSTDSGNAIATDTAGNVYVVGSAAGTVAFYSANGVAFGTTLSSAGGTDWFVAKYNSSGTVQWVSRVAYSSNDSGLGVVTDSAGNVYVVGQTTNAAAAYNTDNTFFGSIVGNAGTYNILVKYNSSGAVQWISSAWGGGTTQARAVAIDSSQNIYTTGSFTTSAFTPGTT